MRRSGGTGKQAWKVYFGGGFQGHRGHDRPGKMHPVDRRFSFGDALWYVPALYVCGEGIVCDFCVERAPERIRAFLEKWDFGFDGRSVAFTPEQETQIRQEDPFALSARPGLTVNGSVLEQMRGYSTGWNPCAPEWVAVEAEAEAVLKHYGLDTGRGWVLLRSSFPWAGKTERTLTSVELTLWPEPAVVPGPHFHVSGAGATVHFTHPVTGEAHTLTVEHWKQARHVWPEQMAKGWDVPQCCTEMTFTLTPDLEREAITVSDCVRDDKARRRVDDLGPRSCAVSAGVLFGTIDPASALHMACSAFHFEPVDDVEWRLEFRVNKGEPLTEKLL